ncbi:HDOD domain-containing protein [Sphaerotilus sp.]|uniref:HDOD domain-containing protein n=1 Tax=Sphaerotilus sp. TaxID=2093942 RepID=UPI002ACEC56A|nr:HDOD domain-containing protein [Sphaerotilus sp.]MDZ7855513.1 HDOD domain-containing protein [Sphaerotilus sp.]
MTDAATTAPAPALGPVLRNFGDFGLLRLLGRSSLTIAWLAIDHRTGEPVRLLASTQPVPLPAMRERCVDDAKRAARLVHPRIAPVREVGCVDRFPYLVCDADPIDLEPPSLAASVLSLDDLVRRAHDLLDGLSYVHEAAMVHGDIGLHTVMVDAGGRLRLWGCGLAQALGNAAQTPRAAAIPPNTSTAVPAAPSLGYLLSREIAACGLLIQHWLLGRAPMGEPDMPTLVRQMTTIDLRLPAELPQPVPVSLRLIIHRAIDLHPQRRFVHARSFERVLGTWRQTQLLGGNGFDAMFAERIRRGGHLPARPMLGNRITTIAGMEKQRLDTVVDVLLEDIALSLGLLRSANAADAAAITAEEPVLTVKRAMQLMGTVGLRRVASGMKPWPGMLKPAGVRALESALQRALLAGHLAEYLAPAGMDAEAAMLAAQFQHLGRLLAAYHFPEELQQIARLRAAGDVGTGQPLSEETATLAVLGVDLQGLTESFLRLWGLNESLRQRVRQIPLDRQVRSPDTPGGWIKLVASCANEIVSVTELAPPAQPAALTAVLNRYHHALALDTEQVRSAMRQARDKLSRHLIHADAAR